MRIEPSPDASGIGAAVRRRLVDDPLDLLRRPPIGWSPGLSLLVVGYGLFALVVGLTTGILSWSTPTLTEAIVFPIALFVFPSLIEEYLFRGVLLPAGTGDARPRERLSAIAASTGLFVLYHPLNAWFVGFSDTSLFTTAPFLAIVTALGLTCSIVRLRTASLWGPIAIHWATVVVWNLVLGRPR